MDQKKVDKRINEYLDTRLMYLIGFANLSQDVINDIIARRSDEFKINTVKAIKKFLEDNKNKLPVDVGQNFLKFVNNENLRFNKRFEGKGLNDDINDIISLANTAKFTDYSFFLKEVRKFYDFGQIGRIFDDDIEQVIELEESVYEYLVDSLFAKDVDFVNKYILGDQGIGTMHLLYIINYLAEDNPIVFEDELLMQRTSLILSTNKTITNTPGIVNHALAEKTFAEKVKCISYLKSFKKKNDSVMRHVVKNIKRS